MSEPATTPTTGLTSIEQADLRVVAGLMIPADPQLGVPGADDPAIISDMAGSLGRDLPVLRRILGIVRSSIEARGAAAAGPDEISALMQHLREQDAAGSTALESVVVRAYYRDDRVLRSIGMEPRPPFPKGYVLDEGNWTLLEPVKARGRIWRDIT